MHLRTITCTVVLLAACRPTEGPASAFSTDPHAVPVALIRFRSDSIAFAQYSGVWQAENLVVRDARTWADLWQRIYADVNPAPPTPSIDFTQEMVVAVALGARNTGGYNVLLTGATHDTGGVLIRASETSPGPHCFTTQAFSQPIDLARVARSDQAVRFAVTQRVVDCRS